MPKGSKDTQAGAGSRRQGVRPSAPLTLDDIVAAAIRLIDAHGADAFSMRNLAKELGVYPTAIYWHVGDRGTLLALVSAAWMHGVLPSTEGMEWDEWLMAMGKAYRAAAHRHPNIARLVASELVNDPTAFGLPEAIVSQLARSGLPDDELVHAYNAMVGATVGFVDLEFARDPVRSDDERANIEDEIRSLDADEYPTLHRFLDAFADQAFSMRWTPADRNPMDESFDYLCELILSGLRNRVATANGASS